MSMPPTEFTHSIPSFPFQAPRDPQRPPGDAYSQTLTKFVKSGLNGQPDPTLTTLIDLGPDHLAQICRTTLRESRYTRDLSASIANNQVLYLPDGGFQQELQFEFSAPPADKKPRWAPLNVTVLQFDSSDEAFNAFTERVASFQSEWKKTLRNNSDVGNYAFQTESSIFWQRWTTVVILESDVDLLIDSTETDLNNVQSIDFVKFAGNLDPMMASNSGPLGDARRAGMQNQSIPSVKINEASKCKIDFTNGAHAVRSVELLDYGCVNLAGEIDADGTFWIIGLKAGAAKLRVHVAQAQSLKVTTVTFSVTVTE